jgi:peroxiredoxin
MVGGAAGLAALCVAPVLAFASPQAATSEQSQKAPEAAKAEEAKAPQGAKAAEGAKGTPAAQAAPTAEGAASKLSTLEIGKPAPDFTLVDTEGNKHTLSDYAKKGRVVVLEWFNPDCPFTKKHHVSFKTMHDLSASLADKNVAWFAINSGAPGKQGAGLERNVKAKKEYGIDYPLLLDESGDVGRAYGAKTTPHMFVIAADGTLAYKGAIDDNPSPTTMGKALYVRTAVDQVLAKKAVATAETKSYGCSVKYAN